MGHRAKPAFLHRQARARKRERSGGHAPAVIVERNAWTLPQERYNAEWILEKQLGLVVRGPHEIPAAAKKLLERGNLARYRAQAATVHNRRTYQREWSKQMMNDNK